MLKKFYLYGVTISVTITFRNVPGTALIGVVVHCACGLVGQGYLPISGVATPACTGVLTLYCKYLEVP